MTVDPARYAHDIGRHFGRLTLIAILPQRIHRRIGGRFQCECGNVCEYPISRIRARGAAHCGCQTDHRTNVRHGMRRSPEYSSWMSMKLRCLSPETKDYPSYGGVGVTVDPAWIDSFEAFFAHIGPRPAGTSLDRIDTTGNYEPGNVRWATAQEQATNRTTGWTVEIDGERYDSVEAAARARHVSTTTITRWCDGSVDARRRSEPVPARANCRRWRTYE